MKRILLLFLLLYPFLLKAQQPSAILKLTRDSLEKNGDIWLKDNWMFHAGDDSLWAAKDLNETGWKSDVRPFINIENGDNNKIGFKEMGWFRFHFHTDSSIVHYPMAFEMMQNGASMVYLDGKLLAQFGGFSKDKQQMYIDPKKKPIMLLISDTGDHVFAVRYENIQASSKLKNADSRMGGFMFQIADHDWAFDNFYTRQRSITTLCLSSGCIFFALFLAHLILFAFYKTDKSNLYFSLFNLGIASFIFLIFIESIAQGVLFKDFVVKWIYVALSLACLSISLFVNQLFGKSRLRSKIILALCLFEMIIPFVYYPLSSYYLSFIALVCACEAAILLSMAMYRKTPGSKIIGVGILFFILFFAIIIIIALIKGEISLDGGFLSVLFGFLGILAVFSIPFSMSAYLAWSFATVNKKLSEKLKQVELLSEEAILHEQEKQQLLENRKEELEHEVALRTTEVMHQKEQIESQHEALKSEKKKSDELLLNILPAEVAEELKEKGQSKAQLFDHVTVLFTDFVNFTQISERLGAEELVAELHECFRNFDDIMERNGLEKIKTIGDAYLAVSGMPVYKEEHAINAIKAALEIIEFIKVRNQNNNTFEIRIGIHSGPLVAGIVGVKKFAYDIWGDTVNTASRMESNSEAGKINISEETHKLVEQHFRCTYRGKINAKHKGDVDMYFVEEMIKEEV